MVAYRFTWGGVFWIVLIVLVYRFIVCFLFVGGVFVFLLFVLVDVVI